MVLPFALATSGSCYLFLFFFIYAILSSCCLRHVKSAPAEWFWFCFYVDNMMTAVGALLILTITTVTRAYLPPMSIIRLIWDPGIASCCAIDRRVWDPGIHRSVGRNTTIPPSSLICQPVLILLRCRLCGESSYRKLIATDMTDANNNTSFSPTASPFDPMVLCSRRATIMQWAPGIANDPSALATVDRSNTSKRHASIESMRCDPFLPWRAPVDGSAPTVDRDPFLLRPMRPMASMFQCCHPVLSRPTVPNVI